MKDIYTMLFWVNMYSDDGREDDKDDENDKNDKDGVDDTGMGNINGMQRRTSENKAAKNNKEEADNNDVDADSNDDDDDDT